MISKRSTGYLTKYRKESELKKFTEISQPWRHKQTFLLALFYAKSGKEVTENLAKTS